MLQPATIAFLKKLKKNNTRDWMDANRAAYLDAKTDFETFTGRLLQALSKKDATIAHLQPKDCTFRINRDIRFSKNKAPYKTNMACYITRGGKKGWYPGYYCHVEPGQAFIAGGIWMPEPALLSKIRQEIDYNLESFEKIIKAKKFAAVFGTLDREEGSALSRPPKGYEADNPAIAYLKLKSFIVRAPVEDALLTHAQLIPEISERFVLMKPLIEFLTTPLLEQD